MTKKRIRMLLLFAVFAICAMVAPQTAFAAEHTTIDVNNSQEFNNAVSTANAATSGEYTIRLTNDIESGGASFNNSCPTTILGNGRTITLGGFGSLFVQPGSQLNLGAKDGSDILKISGGNEQGNDVPGLLDIKGSCNMYPGVTIADRKGNNYYGGGVSVWGGNFHMYGGTIKNCGISGGSMCYGGGVAVAHGSSFIMDGGEITECSVMSNYSNLPQLTSVGGGVCVIGGSSFVMNGGTISNNSADEMGGGIAVVASYDEIKNEWGNLKSSVQILGGTIKGNKANDGAGVFASAFFYTGYVGFSVETPAENPGLFVKNATISNNTANQDEGYGAGVLTVALASPAKAEICSCSITGNSGAVGGGVMSYDKFTNLTIDNCVITGNHATTYGGGFAAESNSGQNAGTVVTNTKLCNNTADKAASDVYVDNSSLKLQSAQTMNPLYQGKPDDVTGKKIDGWYIDNEDLRYTEQTKEQRSEFTGYTDIASNGKTYLIAAVKPSLAKITFANEDGSLLYSEDWYAIGTKAELIKVPTPTKPSDDKYDYVFDSWHTDIADVTQDFVYKAQFKKVPKKNAGNPDGDNPNKPDKDDQKPGADDQKPGGTDSDQKPGTGDKEPGDKKDNQSNKDNADNNDGDNDAPNAENVIPATGDAACTLVIASLLIACCALAVAVIAKRKQSNL